jgi:hypothetical protein
MFSATGGFGNREVRVMAMLRRLFLTRVGPDVFGASVVQPTLTAVGVFTFLAGALYLPSLGPTRVELILALLLLAVFALLCTAVGQLAVVIERLEVRDDKDAQPAAAPDRAACRLSGVQRSLGGPGC